ncbi:hypothetical protein, partial [Serratia marcescens]
YYADLLSAFSYLIENPPPPSYSISSGRLTFIAPSGFAVGAPLSLQESKTSPVIGSRAASFIFVSIHPYAHSLKRE